MDKSSWPYLTELVQQSAASGQSLADIVMAYQVQITGLPAAEVRETFARRLEVMRSAVASGLKGGLRSPSGLIGGDAKLVESARQAGQLLSGATTARAVAYALAVAEVNACMGLIVAAPTAGACGILPGVLLALEAERGIAQDRLIDGLLVAAGVGLAAARQASFSGAALGCQSECGAAAAMAAAAAVAVAGGQPAAVEAAAAIALKSLLGLVCDPVGGLVEIPCVKRNATGAALALAAADIALAGVSSFIPFDEVVAAMVQVGRSLPPSLRETGTGGVAACPAARKLVEQLQF